MLVVGVAAMSALLAVLASAPAVPLSLQVVVKESGVSSSKLNPGALIMVEECGEKSSFYIKLKVTDSKGNPVEGATCVVSGLGGYASGTTKSDGECSLSPSKGGSQIELPCGSDGSLKLLCTHGSYEKYEKEDAIIVLKV